MNLLLVNKVYNANVAGMDMEEYVRKNQLHRLEPYSGTLKEFLDHMRNNKPVPDVMMSRETMRKIDQEIETYLAKKLYSHPTFNFDDLALDVLTSKGNVEEM